MDFLTEAQIFPAAEKTRKPEKKRWTFLRCQEVLLSPREEAKVMVGNKQMLSLMVANYLMIGVLGQVGQLAGLDMLPASSM